MSKLTNNLAETAENYFDNSLLEITDTIFEEILKAIPLASSGLAIYNVFKSYTERQKLKNILEFIRQMFYWRLRQKLHEIYATLDGIASFKIMIARHSWSVVRKTYNTLEIPSLDEGFDEIFKVKIVRNNEFTISLNQ